MDVGLPPALLGLFNEPQCLFQSLQTIIMAAQCGKRLCIKAQRHGPEYPVFEACCFLPSPLKLSQSGLRLVEPNEGTAQKVPTEHAPERHGVLLGLSKHPACGRLRLFPLLANDAREG